jgi:Pyruvate/2-oxoacid:ferredoxin oxidoreductase delta subunit
VSAPLVQLRPKKLAPNRRRPRLAYRSETRWWRRLVLRVRDDPRALRLAVQLTFAALCLWIGIEFHRFVAWGQSHGSLPYAPRPPGVEGFLPISALISAKHFVTTGVVDRIHPAALFILSAIVLLSLAVKKAFCSFLCPVGTFSEYLWRLGRFVYRRNIALPRWLDVPLRALKYALLGFFVWSIARMDLPTLDAFIGSPYNKVADIKLYLFFAQLSGLALKVVVVLVVLSLFIKNVWCRYLCPYGALLGIVGLFSPAKITRDKDRCIDCRLCTRACPAAIQIHRRGRVWSDECTSCLECVAVCPVKQTLEVKAARHTVSPWQVAAIVLAVFLGVTGVGMSLGHWRNDISAAEYLQRFTRLDQPAYQHERGHVPSYSADD